MRFKEHFKYMQKQLQVICGPTMQQAGYHNASHLAQQLREDIQRGDEELLMVIQSSVDTALQAPSLTLSDIRVASLVQQLQANAIQGDMIQLEMLKIL